MKKFLCLLVLVATSLLAPQACANDYFFSEYDDCCGTNFSGPYFGVNVGGSFRRGIRINNIDPAADDFCCSSVDANVTAGVQLGYDWRCDYMLLGVVTDWNWVDDNNRNHDGFNWFNTIRGRAGLTIRDTLIYFTGGTAVTRFDRIVDLQNNIRDNKTRWGLSVGAGAEFLLSCNFTLGVEVLYFHFPFRERCPDNLTLPPPRNSESAWVGRFTINYRFGDLFCHPYCGYSMR
jgi:opacity protein-like surface antigen